MVQLSPHWLPLLPRRSMLLRQPSACTVNMVLPAIEAPFHQHLLPRLWQQCSRNSYVEE